ncbi:MAG: hypothetical protein BGO57_02640 [Sphingomonadales bacterium 63-6]|nr:MAG: hypothetical protein BGO57_02640 [Sphingomonadales bacterium 63-6]
MDGFLLGLSGRNEDYWGGGQWEEQVLLPQFRHAELVSASISPDRVAAHEERWILKQVQDDGGRRIDLPEETLSCLSLHCFDPPQGGDGDATREQARE